MQSDLDALRQLFDEQRNHRAEVETALFSHFDTPAEAKRWLSELLADSRLLLDNPLSSDRFRELRASIEKRVGMMHEATKAYRAENRANTSVVFSGTAPTTDVRDLAFKLANRGTESELSIALEFTRQNKSKADSLLAQIRRLKKKGRITFISR